MNTQATNDQSPIWRRKKVCEYLGVCESQVLKFETSGVLTPIKPPNVRAIWYDADQVRRLAENIRRGKLSSEPVVVSR